MTKKRSPGQASLFELEDPSPAPGAYGAALDRPPPKRTEPARRCFWPGCEEFRPSSMLGCSPHWFRLPKHLRDRIWRHYRPGQEADGELSQEYVAALETVLRWVREQTEGHHAS